LCLTWLGRPPDWTGKVEGDWFGRSGGRQVGPPVKVGVICDRCKVPVVRLAKRDDPYPKLVIIADDGEIVPPGALEVVLDWCRAKGFPVD
jgi:hypothetical protein